MTPAAIYARYSSDRQNPETIEVQVDKCLAYGDREGLTVEERHIYTDQAKSGMSEAGRVEYMAMLAAAAEGAFEVVVAYMFDRIGRDFLENTQSIHKLQGLGIEVWSATQGKNPFMRDISLAVAEETNRRHAERVRDALSAAAKKGRWIGGRPPFGYRKIQAEGDEKPWSLEIIPEQAAIVKRIYSMYADGTGGMTITYRLNQEGVPTEKGSTWDASTVQNILTNPAYRGYVVWNRRKGVRQANGKRSHQMRPRSEWIIAKGAHPAIIEDDLWERCESWRRFRDKHRGEGKRHGGERAAFSKYLLTGLLVCGECGKNYGAVGSGENAKRKSPNYYRCGTNQRRGKTACSNVYTLRKERVEAAVFDLLQNRKLTQDGLSRMVDEIRASFQVEDHTQEEEVKAEIKRAEKELRHLVGAIKATGISGALAEEYTRVEARKEALLMEQEKLIRTAELEALPTRKEIREMVRGFKAVVKEAETGPIRAALREIIEQITVYPDGAIKVELDYFGLKREVLLLEV